MEDLKRTTEGAPLLVLRASIIRDIINDVYALAETIEWELRDTPSGHRRAKKDSYKTKNMEIKLCELKFHNGIRMHIQFGHGNDIYNKLFLIIDKNGDHSVCIKSAELSNLIMTRNDILELLLDLTNNRGYDYMRPLPIEEHAIMIYNKSILTSIECNKYSDRNYYKLKCDRTKYVSKDEEMNAIVCHDLKAAYVKNGEVFVGGVLK